MLYLRYDSTEYIMRRAARGRAKPARVRRKLVPKTPRQQLQSLFEYAAFMEEPLNMALDLTRGLNLVADGLNANDDRENGQPVLVLGRLIAGQLAQVKGILLTLLKAAGEELQESA
jgi:hypothetical protein